MTLEAKGVIAAAGLLVGGFAVSDTVAVAIISGICLLLTTLITVIFTRKVQVIGAKVETAGAKVEAKVDEVHVVVNARATKQDEKIELLTKQNAAMLATIEQLTKIMAGREAGPPLPL